MVVARYIMYRVTEHHNVVCSFSPKPRDGDWHEACSITQFKYGVAGRGASIRIPRTAEKDGRGYMEDRRPAANCDPYRVAARVMKTAGECLEPEKEAEAEKKD